MNSPASRSKKISGIIIILLLWLFIAWLLYPLLVLDVIEMEKAKAYLYRTALGTALMIILFGKTVFDLFFPQAVSKKVPLIHTIFLTVYSLGIIGGIIILVARLISLYIKNQDSGFLF